MALFLCMIEYVANKIIYKMNTGFSNDFQKVWQTLQNRKQNIMTFYWIWWSGTICASKMHLVVKKLDLL